MNKIYIILGMFLVSFVLGFIKYKSLSENYKNQCWQLKFLEIWNDFINFFIAGLIGYYFILIRWPLLEKGETLNIGDFVLFIIFMFSVFGHLCVLSKNITEGVEVIIKKILRN
jgi:hypothetical protein